MSGIIQPRRLGSNSNQYRIHPFWCTYCTLIDFFPNFLIARWRQADEIMLVSAEEVLDVRGSLLHVIETEAILLQLLRQLSLYQPKGLPFLRFFFLSLGQQSRRYYSTLRNIRFPWYSATRPNFLVVFFPICSLTDSRPADTELRLKHILLEASGQIHLHKDVAQVSFVSFGEISHFFNLWWCQALSRKTRERERRESSSGLWSRIDIHDRFHYYYILLLPQTTIPTNRSDLSLLLLISHHCVGHGVVE